MLERVWEELLAIVGQEVGSHVVQTWLKAVNLERWDPIERVVYVQVPNQFIRSWVQSNYQTLLELHCARLFSVQSLRIQFIDMSSEQSGLRVDSSEEKKILPAVSAVDLEPVQNPVMFEPGVQRKRSFVNDSYRFESFVVGPSNQLAHAAAKAVAVNLARIYNPLFIYGGSGLGKTHLLHAIGNEVRERHKRAEVLYQPADRFVSEFIGAIRFDKVHQFKARYREIDLLLIDDVQFISNKEQTQEAFFHIFNDLYGAKKQIVISSDTDPAGINGLAERLRSRFEWGLVADIGLPTLETKIAILQKKAIVSQYTVSEEVLEYIASRPLFNIRELEGALIRVVAYASLANQSVTLDTAKKVLARTKKTHEEQIDFKHILRGVQKRCQVPLSGIRSTKRNKDLVFARHIAMYLMKKLTNRSLEQIGDFFGGKDHTTVMHAVNKMEYQVMHNKEIGGLIALIEDDLLR